MKEGIVCDLEKIYLTNLLDFGEDRLKHIVKNVMECKM